MVKSLRSQYFLGGILTLLTMLVLLLWSAQRLMHDALETRLETELEIAAPLLSSGLAPLLASRDYVGAQELVLRSAGTRHLAYVELRDNQERLLARSGDDQREGLRSTVREITLAGQRLGSLRLAIDASAQQAAHHALIRNGLLIGGAVLAMALVMLALWTRWVNAGLQRLALASQRVAAGDYELALPSEGASELSQLAEAFNRMSSAIRDQLGALRESEQHQRSLVASMAGGLLVYDAKGQVQDWNDAALRMLGQSVQQLGDGSGAAFHFKGLPRQEDLPWARALRTGLPQRDALLQCQQADGSSRWISVNAEPRFHAGDARPTGVVCSLSDVTRHVQGEQALRALNEGLETRVQQRTAELQAARDAAERASLAKSQFLSRMSHELRTPLNAILGFAQLLDMSKERLRVSEREKIAQIERAGWHLLELINDVLDLSRIEAGELSTELEPVQVDELVGETIQMLGSLTAQQAVQLELAPAPDCWVRADRKRLRQVLNNLLSNALKYNHAGGKVRVHAEALPGEQIGITVSDTGRGMSAEQLAELYRPFVRFERRDDNTAGTGIGLVITKRLVELMGGSIDVSSELGRGTVFTVTLPACRPPISTPELPASLQSTATALRHHRLLYIEDNAANAEMLRSLMAHGQRFELSIAADGLSGLEMLRSLQPDLLLVDIDLPGIDGVEVCRRVRADPRTQDLPLIALSANAMPSEVRRALAAGFDRYVTKPVDFPVLLRSIDELLAKCRPAAL